MFGKPHAFSEAGSVPSVPASAAAFAFAQNVRSCPDEPEQRRVSASDWPNSTGFHVTVAKVFLAATGPDFPAERAGTWLPWFPPRAADKPAAWVSQWVWPGHVPVVPFPNPGEITALPGSRIAHGETITGKEAMHHPFWKSKWFSAMVLCSRSPQPEMGTTPVCSPTCYNTAVMSSC